MQAVRELGENGGSNIRTVEKFISSSYDVELDQVSQILTTLSVNDEMVLSVFSLTVISMNC